MKFALCLGLIIAAVGLNSCANSTAKAAPPQEVTLSEPLFNGHYVWWGTGQYWGGGQDGGNALPAGIPNTEFKVLYDSGTFDADGNGHATHCGGGAWGTWTTPVNCGTQWTYKFGFDDSGNPINSRMGLITSAVGDKATLACTDGGKHCVMTAHGVGWAWNAILQKE